MSEEKSTISKLRELAFLFLRLGTVSFGGPAVHIAMMEQEFVRKRGWMSKDHFLDLYGATNLIPGPNSTQMTMHIGNERAGWKGLVVSGVCFMLPSILLTAVFAVLYKQYGQLPQIEPFFFGVKPVIIAIILGAMLPLAKKSLKSIPLYFLGGFTLVMCFLGVSTVAVLFGAGLLGLILAMAKRSSIARSMVPLTLLPATGSTVLSVSYKGLFFTFLKIGSILYGSGYVLFAFLDSSLVSKGLLTRQQLMDAIAVGQFTPGPILSAVTFVGYQIKGYGGALAATVGIFLPSFLFVVLLQPLIPRMRKSYWFSALLDAVNVAAIAIILFICIQMGIATATGWKADVLLLLALIVVFGYKKANTMLVILGGAVTGYLLGWI